MVEGQRLIVRLPTSDSRHPCINRVGKPLSALSNRAQALQVKKATMRVARSPLENDHPSRRTPAS